MAYTCMPIFAMMIQYMCNTFYTLLLLHLGKYTCMYGSSEGVGIGLDMILYRITTLVQCATCTSVATLELMHVFSAVKEMVQQCHVMSCHCDQTERYLLCGQQCRSAIWLVERESQAVDEATLLSQSLHWIYYLRVSLVSVSLLVLCEYVAIECITCYVDQRDKHSLRSGRIVCCPHLLQSLQTERKGQQ